MWRLCPVSIAVRLYMVTYFRTLFSLSFTPFPFREFAALSCMVIIPLSRLVISGFLSVRPSVLSRIHGGALFFLTCLF